MLDDRIIQKLHIDWDKIDDYSYLRQISALQGLHDLEFQKNITFFVGENGSGKSTLLEAIAVAYGFNPEGGTINYSFSTYEDVSELHNAMTLAKGIQRQKFGYFFRAESFFNVSTMAEEYGSNYGGKRLHAQSHGESFLSFFEEYNRKGLYIMDEPEAALSPQRQLSVLIYIAQMAAEGSQFIIATHSPILLGIPNAEILSFDDGEIHPCAYEDTESYQVTKMFLTHREKMLEGLLGE